MRLGLRVALLNLYVVTCLLPWQGAAIATRLAIALGGLVVLVVGWLLRSIVLDVRLLLGVGIFLGIATLRPWPSWSFAVILGSALAVLLLGFDRGPSGERLARPSDPRRWRRRMALTSSLAWLATGSGLALLCASASAELLVAGRPPGAAILLCAGTGLLGLFVMRQFFLQPVIEHIAEDSGIRPWSTRGNATQRHLRWGRLLLWCGVALVSGIFLLQRGS